MISGIVHVLKSGGRRTDAPREVYAPKKSLYNRFVRWAANAVWVGLFETLAQAERNLTALDEDDAPGCNHFYPR